MKNIFNGRVSMVLVTFALTIGLWAGCSPVNPPVAPVASTSAPVKVLKVAAGSSHSLALKSDDTLWATGYNFDGELGNGTTTDTDTWIRVFSNVSAITAGAYHSLALMSDDTLWATGYNLMASWETGRRPIQTLGSGFLATSALSPRVHIIVLRSKTTAHSM